MSESYAGMMQDVGHEVSLVARNMLLAVAVAGAAILIVRISRGLIERLAFFRELPVVGQTLARNAVSFFVGIVACTVILGLWGATWSAIAAGIGLSTLAIALGLQDVLKSIAGGVVILLERPFDIGDRIRIKDLTGEVVDLRVRHIVLRMDDGHLAIAPNGLLFSEPCENFSRSEGYSYAISVSNIAQPAREARARIDQALSGNFDVQQPPSVLLQRDLRQVIPWPLSNAGAKNGHVRSAPRHRAVISWNSETEETAITALVQKLQAQFPEAEITVRRR